MRFFACRRQQGRFPKYNTAFTIVRGTLQGPEKEDQLCLRCSATQRFVAEFWGYFYDFGFSIYAESHETGHSHSNRCGDTVE